MLVFIVDSCLFSKVNFQLFLSNDEIFSCVIKFYFQSSLFEIY
jgi:hypothetical protein